MERAPLVVLALGLFLTVVSAYGAYKSVRERDTLRFQLAVESVEQNLSDRLNSYLGVVWAGVGLFQANDLNVTQAQLRKFRLAAESGRRNDGLIALTFVRRVKLENRVAFEEKMRKRIPSFSIYPSPQVEPNSPLFAVTHIEPMTKQRLSALGFNPFTDPIRRSALTSAKETGLASFTDKVTLKSEEDLDEPSDAVILYAPVYDPGTETLSQEERATRIYGFVGASFYLTDLAEHLKRWSDASLVGFEIDSGGKGSEVLVRSGDKPGDPRFTVTKTYQVPGDKWTICFWSLPEFSRFSGYQEVSLSVIFGSLLSLTLYGLAVLQFRARKAKELALYHETERAKDLELQDKVKTKFFSNLNHELRTPLNGILGMSDLLHDTELNQQQREYLDSIGACGKALLELVNDVLDLSKIEAGKMSIHPTTVASKEIFQQALRVVRGPADGKGVRLRFQWDDTIPPYIQTDGVRLRQVLINLLGNAVKFTDKGSVTLDVKKSGEELVFAVQDTGVGISTEDQKALFRPFSQVGSVSRSGAEEGTGLGLHLCKELMELLGGHIEVESEPGKGSLFRCTMPLVEADEDPMATQKMKVLAGRPERPMKILVADDNPINRRVMKLQLEKFGQVVMTADSGKTAVEKAQEETLDLILMDCQMPEMDGLEATRQIREIIGDELPIVALTAFAEDRQRQACLEAGMSDFLIKPVDSSRLLAVLEKFCSPIG